MSTRPRAWRHEGFTLIEVLMAMVLLAICLIGLLPLGVISVRQVGLGERDSRSAATGTRYLEDALQQIHVGRRPEPCNLTLANGDQVVRTVALSTSPTVPSRVVVTVTPEPRGGTPRPYTLRSFAFSPIPIGPNAPAQACPQ